MTREDTVTISQSPDGPGRRMVRAALKIKSTVTAAAVTLKENGKVNGKKLHFSPAQDCRSAASAAASVGRLVSTARERSCCAGPMPWRLFNGWPGNKHHSNDGQFLNLHWESHQPSDS
jgi:hypothetical protein